MWLPPSCGRIHAAWLLLVAVIGVQPAAHATIRLKVTTTGPDDLGFIASVWDPIESIPICSGVLVDLNRVAIPASCLGFNRDITPLVKIGQVDLSQESEVYRVDKIIVHPKFNGAVRGSGNIAILVLDKQVVGHEPISILDSVEECTHASLTAVGWFSYRAYSTSKHLEAIAGLKTMDRYDCEQSIGMLPHEAMCAVLSFATVDHPWAEGALLLCHERHVVGLMSYGPAGYVAGPYVFLSLPYFKEWIGNVRNEEADHVEEGLFLPTSCFGDSVVPLKITEERCGNSFAFVANLHHPITKIHKCSGALVAPGVVATTGTCLSLFEGIFPEVRVGSLEVNGKGAKHAEVSRTCAKIIHKRFKAGKVAGPDLGLVTLDPKTVHSAPIRSMMPLENCPNGNIRYVGWFRHRADLHGMAKMIPVAGGVCERVIGKMHEDSVCAKADATPNAVYDPGAPLLCDGEHLIGFASRTKTTDQYYPIAFTEAAKFEKWIEEVGGQDTQEIRNPDCDREL